jgi:FixJ family two-component response regulator
MMDRDAFLVRVIDDDAAVRDSLEALLAVTGYPVATYGSAEEYLLAPEDEANGCILLDLHMPGMGGLGLMEALARRLPALPVVVLTAAREPGLHERATGLGARAVLTKPVRRATLLETLASLGGTARV